MAKSQLITPLKRLQSGVQVRREYWTAHVSLKGFSPEPHDLELRFLAGLADETVNCELLVCAHIHRRIFLHKGQVASYQKAHINM